jgi:uncharacterized cupin superfamily protein
VPWEEFYQGERFGGRYRHLTIAAVGEDYHVGVAIEELPPGRQSTPAHYHIFEEEHVYILEGTLTARIGTASYRMESGDYVCFPAGQKAGHCLINTSEATCRYVMIGERNPNEVVVYTDSKKVLVRALGRRAIFDLAARRGYWDGENTGIASAGITPLDLEPLTMSEPAEPGPPISSRDVDWEVSGEGTNFGGRVRHLTHAAVGGNYHVGVLIEDPAPGRRLAPLHYHMLEEEHALIMEGQANLQLGDARYDMRSGDYVCFPAGQKVGHCFMNNGTVPCRYLMIGQRNPNDVCVYPDSEKMAVSALRTRDDIFDMRARRRYWDGEETGGTKGG